MTQGHDQDHADGVVADELSRFVHAVHRAMPTATLTWSERVQIHRDLGFLILEARSTSSRPQLIDVFINCICDALDRGDLPSDTRAWLRVARPMLEQDLPRTFGPPRLARPESALTVAGALTEEGAA